MGNLIDRARAAFGSKGLLWLLKGSALVFGIQIAGQVISYVNQIILVRAIGSAELGNFVYATNMVMLLAALVAFGYQQGAIRFVVDGEARSDPAYVRGYVRLGMLIALAGSLILGGGGILIWLMSDRSGQTAFAHPALPIALCLLPVLSLMTLYGTVGRALKLFTVSFLPNSLIRPVGILVFILSAIAIGFEYTALTLIVVFIVIMCAGVAWQAIIVIRHINRRFDVPERTYETRLWVLTGFQLLVFGLAEGQLPRISVALSGALLSPTDVAILNICFTYVSPVALGLFALNSVMAPNASKLYAESKTDELQRLIAHLCHFRLWPCLLAVAILIAAGPWLLRIFGPEFEAGYSTLILIAIARVIIAAFGPQAFMVTFMGLQRGAMVIFLVSVAVLIGLTFVLLPTFGLVGSGIAVLLTTVMWNVGLHVLITSKSGLIPSILCWQRVGIWPKVGEQTDAGSARTEEKGKGVVPTVDEDSTL